MYECVVILVCDVSKLLVNIEDVLVNTLKHSWRDARTRNHNTPLVHNHSVGIHEARQADDARMISNVKRLKIQHRTAPSSMPIGIFISHYYCLVSFFLAKVSYTSYIVPAPKTYFVVFILLLLSPNSFPKKKNILLCMCGAHYTTLHYY
jgi:hypothetical protein